MDLPIWKSKQDSLNTTEVLNIQQVRSVSINYAVRLILISDNENKWLGIFCIHV